jgi:hypothetical protein
MSPKGTDIPMATLLPVVRPELRIEVLLNEAVVVTEGDKENNEDGGIVVVVGSPVATGLPEIVTGRITPLSITWSAYSCLPVIWM